MAIYLILFKLCIAFVIVGGNSLTSDNLTLTYNRMGIGPHPISSINKDSYPRELDCSNSNNPCVWFAQLTQGVTDFLNPLTYRTIDKMVNFYCVCS